MAHAQKCKRDSVVGLAIHFERRPGCELSNKDIDASKSYLNYNLASSYQTLRPEEFISKRLSEVKHINRKDIVVMVDWIITLPANVFSEDKPKFFESSLSFLEEKYGKENIVSAWVHEDESTPHIHISFVPVIKENGIEKLNCKKILTRDELRKFHPDLGTYLHQQLGYLPEVQNNATINGNRSIKELKNQEDLSLKKAKEIIKENIDIANEIKIAQPDDSRSIFDKVKSIKQANKVIDKLSISNKKLKRDNLNLINIIDIQKEEINMYRNMPLAKQLSNSKELINNIRNQSSYLNSRLQELQITNDILIDENTKLNQEIISTKYENSLYKSFISTFHLNDIFEEFKDTIKKSNLVFKLQELKELCLKIINMVSQIIEHNDITEEIYLDIDKTQLEQENVQQIK